MKAAILKNRQLKISNRQSRAFTLVEIAVAIVVVGLIVSSGMAILDRLIGAMADMRLRSEAFEIAREKMETLLAQAKVQDMTDYGTSELRPDIQWQTTLEPFYEPITNQMWIRAVCSAGYNDSKGSYQSIDLEHWITNLSPQLVKQILDQQKVEQEYLDLLGGTASGQEEALVQETTAAFLTQAGLDVDAYLSFLKRQRQKKLDHLSKYGMDDGYYKLLEELRQDEDRFLQVLGMDFDAYNAFAPTYTPTGLPSGNDGTVPTAPSPEEAANPPQDAETPDTDVPEEGDPPIDWDRIPPELRPLIESLLKQR